MAFMNETSMDDLALFLDVAAEGTLTRAAARAGVPLPTLSRRMRGLERDLGRALFLRGKAGFALTEEGRALAEEVAGLGEVARRLARWRAEPGRVPRVRITAGFWTSRRLARSLEPGPEGAAFVPAFLPSNANLDLARREADIGIRNREPDHPWLARRRLGRVRFAVYGRDEGVTGYVALPPGDALTPSLRWLYAARGDEIVTTASDTRLCLDLALSGFGRIVMPTFAGDAEPGLVRLEGPIPELDHDEWLVSHHEARHDAPIRAALDAIAAAFAGVA